MHHDRESVTRRVLESLEDLTERPSNRIRLKDRLVSDLGLDGDDFSFVFVPGLEQALGIRTDPLAWEHLVTVGQVIEYLVASTRRASSAVEPAG